MNASAELSPDKGGRVGFAHELVAFAPLAAAIAYPFLLKGFHFAVTKPDATSIPALGMATACLSGAILMPILGFAWAGWLSREEYVSSLELRARRLAYLVIITPPLFVFIGVTRGLVGSPLSDEIVWLGLWLIVGVSALIGSGREIAAVTGPMVRSRVAHGVSAALIVCFVLFHLSNHLLGWLGPEIHQAVMSIGRVVYRSRLVEPILIVLLLFQLMSGVRLAWYWSAQSSDLYRVFQIGSGVYLAAFIVTHLNSALVSARLVRGYETDWAWASGAPEGLIFDQWNIRLLPHYALGVFFVLSHLASGLRQVLIAHDVDVAVANRIWLLGLVASALMSLGIVFALCGARL